MTTKWLNWVVAGAMVAAAIALMVTPKPARSEEFRGCMMLSEVQHWPKEADHYGPFDAARLMRQVLAEASGQGPHADFTQAAIPKVDDLYALPVGGSVLLIRVTGTTLCPDDPVDRDIYEAARRVVVGGDA